MSRNQSLRYRCFSVLRIMLPLVRKQVSPHVSLLIFHLPLCLPVWDEAQERERSVVECGCGREGALPAQGADVPQITLLTKHVVPARIRLLGSFLLLLRFGLRSRVELLRCFDLEDQAPPPPPQTRDSSSRAGNQRARNKPLLTLGTRDADEVRDTVR